MVFTEIIKIRKKLPIEINCLIDKNIYYRTNCDNNYRLILHKNILTELKMSFSKISIKYLNYLGIENKFINLDETESQTHAGSAEQPTKSCGFVKVLDKKENYLFKLDGKHIFIDYYEKLQDLKEKCSILKNYEKIYNLIYCPKVWTFNNNTNKYDTPVCRFYFIALNINRN